MCVVLELIEFFFSHATVLTFANKNVKLRCFILITSNVLGIFMVTFCISHFSLFLFFVSSLATCQKFRARNPLDIYQ